MSRLIDGDELMELLTTAIRNMKGMAKFLCAEDDPEIQMEIKAYTDIANGVKDIPTIESERKPGKWIGNHTTCSECGWQMIDDVTESPNMVGFNYCPYCGADMREGAQE